MGVEVLGVPNEGNGHGDSMDAFRDSHLANSKILVNLANGRKKNAVTPPYDPEHPDNKWPLMIYHPAKGELVVKNQEGLDEALQNGYRTAPYLKPQVAVLDPAAEKKAMLEKNQELEGLIIAQNDRLERMEAAFKAATEPAKAEPAKADAGKGNGKKA